MRSPFLCTMPMAGRPFHHDPGLMRTMVSKKASLSV
jgi:hypothetical protein